MRVGPLRHKIKFQYRVSSSDGYGGQLEDWLDYAVAETLPDGAVTEPGEDGAMTVVGLDGAVTGSDTNIYVRASVDPIIGREYMAAKQVQSEATHRVRLRYIAGITTDMRIVFGDRIFGIESVLNVSERNREIVIMASELL